MKITARNQEIKNYIIYLSMLSLVVILRRPDAILHPELWAEDGVLWYTQAYNSGFPSLFMPENGYLQTISRIAALAAQPFPIYYVPYIFAVFAFCAQMLPVALLLSRRFDSIIPDKKIRIIISIIYVLMPNSYEVNMNLTNAQWHLALVLFLLLVGNSQKRYNISDYMLMVVAGLSGPFSVLLSPVAMIEWYRNKFSGDYLRYVIALSCAAVQAVFIVASMMQTRSAESLGASMDNFVHIIVNNIFVGGLLGNVENLLQKALVGNYYAVFAFFSIILVLAFFRGPLAYKEFSLFSLCVILSALISPMISLTEPQWPLMAIFGIGDRYYVIPIISMLVGFVVLSADKNIILKSIGRFLLVSMFCAVPFNFSYPNYVRTGFYKEAMYFAGAPRGTVVKFDENPSGWNFALTKK
ncbi:hypothetical protein [Acidithiobacillus sulfuriphilus]|uniref:DUF2029 domain-containing protein n=2 Tax=Acidithiobacillus sulfuriphilus TaxID=1867749 RepID=A0A3M8RVF5_9PROT|nr:hypothetical protein [Acidithiobacillus sulfuriphilus]RNF71712.1 hypothetical protein EC580_01470 [Acidithiobacillus sulfuriphilus]